MTGLEPVRGRRPRPCRPRPCRPRPCRPRPCRPTMPPTTVPPTLAQRHVARPAATPGAVESARPPARSPRQAVDVSAGAPAKEELRPRARGCGVPPRRAPAPARLGRPPRGPGGRGSTRAPAVDPSRRVDPGGAAHRARDRPPGGDRGDPGRSGPPRRSGRRRGPATPEPARHRPYNGFRCAST